MLSCQSTGAQLEGLVQSIGTLVGVCCWGQAYTHVAGEAQTDCKHCSHALVRGTRTQEAGVLHLHNHREVGQLLVKVLGSSGGGGNREWGRTQVAGVSKCE